MKKIAILLLSLIALSTLKAQTDELRGENRSLRTAEVQGLRLPANIDDICFFDGRLHLSSGGMLFGVSVNKGHLGFPEVDTALTSIDAQMTYAVRHNVTGAFYYTKIDSKGRTFLYEYYEKKPGKYDTRRIKPYGFSYTIEHPVFSSDGRAMVFASDCPIGFGGRDLWYSEWHNGQWQYPQNLGHRINGEGDETMPAIYGDYLIFASSSRNDSYGGSDLYATRLVALEQTGDTVMMYPIGQSAVQSLEVPFCSVDADWGVTFDGNDGGWWVRGDSLSGSRLFSFAGKMDCIRVSGMVSDVNGNILDGAIVTYKTSDNRQGRVVTDERGCFAFYVQPSEDYELECRADNHFIYRQPLRYERSKEDRLYDSERYNIVLDAFDLGVVYNYDDLFGSPVSSELSPSGRARMDKIALFLIENSNLRLQIASAYDLSIDAPFCTLLNNARLRTLTDHLVAKGVTLNTIDTTTVKPANAPENSDDESLSSTAMSSLMVYFVFEK